MSCCVDGLRCAGEGRDEGRRGIVTTIELCSTRCTDAQPTAAESISGIPPMPQPTGRCWVRWDMLLVRQVIVNMVGVIGAGGGLPPVYACGAPDTVSTDRYLVAGPYHHHEPPKGRLWGQFPSSPDSPLPLMPVLPV